MKRINLVVGEKEEGGDLEVLYVGRSHTEARKALAKAVDDGKLYRVVHYRNPKHKLAKRPSAVAKRRKTLAAERKEREKTEARESKEAAKAAASPAAAVARTDGADGSNHLPLGPPAKTAPTKQAKTKTAPDKDSSS